MKSHIKSRTRDSGWRRKCVCVYGQTSNCLLWGVIVHKWSVFYFIEEHHIENDIKILCSNKNTAHKHAMFNNHWIFVSYPVFTHTSTVGVDYFFQKSIFFKWHLLFFSMKNVPAKLDKLWSTIFALPKCVRSSPTSFVFTDCTRIYWIHDEINLHPKVKCHLQLPLLLTKAGNHMTGKSFSLSSVTSLQNTNHINTSLD